MIALSFKNYDIVLKGDCSGNLKQTNGRTILWQFLWPPFLIKKKRKQNIDVEAQKDNVVLNLNVSIICIYENVKLNFMQR